MAEKTSSPLIYLVVFALLVLLTGLTTWAAFWDTGRWHDVVALAIAVSKTVLVVLFFMHALHGTRLVGLTIFAAFAWLAILISLTMSDYLTRGWIMDIDAW